MFCKLQNFYWQARRAVPLPQQSHFFYYEQSYLSIYWTDFHDLFTNLKVFSPFFPIPQGTMPWQPSTVLVCYYLLRGDTAAPSGLYARLSHALLVFIFFHRPCYLSNQFLGHLNRQNWPNHFHLSHWYFKQIGFKRLQWPSLICVIFKKKFGELDVL